MADCDKEPCDCPVCLENKNLLRLECNGRGGQHHYLCSDCLMQLRQFSQPEPDSFQFVPPRQVKWKLCPTCRKPIKRASHYNFLLRHSRRETSEEYHRREADPTARRGYLPETDLQDEEFAREQSNRSVNELINMMIQLDAARDNVVRLEGERQQIIQEINQQQIQQNQEQNNRYAAIAALVVAGGIIVYRILCITGPLIAPLIGGDNENKMEIDRSNGIGVIYIGYSEGVFGVWWSTIQSSGTILNILINNEEQYKKLLDTYKFTTNPEIDIAMQILEVTKLNQGDTNNELKKGGTRNKRKMKRRSSRRKNKQN
jgi:hypothetical protein